MNTFRLVIRSFAYFWRKNLALALGVAITSTVITGSLIVGDSVQQSLYDIASKRLGNTGFVMDCGDRFVTARLVQKIRETGGREVAPLLMTDGVAVAGGGRVRLNQVNVNGVNDHFEQVVGGEGLYSRLRGDSVIISENLSQRLSVSEGEEFLLRMERARIVPANAPFVSDADNSVSVRVFVKKIAGEKDMGAFNLKTSQTAPYNIFISLTVLHELMELEDRVNFLLFPPVNTDYAGQIRSLVESNWELPDAGFELEEVPGSEQLQLSTGRVFIDSIVSEKLDNVPADPRQIITYFVNSINHQDRSTPYSFVSSATDYNPGKNRIIINDWLAEDLAAQAGDTIGLKFFVIGPLRELETDSISLMVERVIPVEDQIGDRLLMPEIPGLSDAGNCRDWETGVPVDLEAIRDKDEAYWTRWKGTPKAFIHSALAVKHWSNRFGNATAFRFNGNKLSRESLEAEIMDRITLDDLGIRVIPVRRQAIHAAGNGVDFSELFLGLSFFLIVGGILLTVLLFMLNVRERIPQIRTLSATGIPTATIRKAYLLEWLLVIMTGAAAGLILSVFYNQLVFQALNSVWADIVRSDMMEITIHSSSLLIGFLSSVLVTLFSVLIPLNRAVKQHGTGKETGYSGKVNRRARRILLITAGLSLLAALTIVSMELAAGEINRSGHFFSAGGLLLISGILVMLYLFLSGNRSGKAELNLWQLGYRNSQRNVSRSLGIVALFAMGTFLVISTGANRKDLFRDAGEKESGTGGYLYYAESTIPVLKNLDNRETRFEYGLGEGYDVTQFRLYEGDDASCLNLNRISNPAILGINPEELRDRFSFVTRTPLLEEDDPWMSLNTDLSGNVVPAIADETVIKWGLGKEVGDTLRYTNARGEEINLVLAGGLAPSIFQGRVIISNSHFLQHFPASSGTNVFLIDGALSDTSQIAADLRAGMRDVGWEMEYAPARLAEFNSVTNTYLTIFLVLGSIGLLLGTVGLAVLLYSTVLERREELAVMRAIGFRMRQLRGLLVREYTGLFLAGTLLGFLSAVIATLPSILSANTDISFSTIGWVLLAMLLNGLFWTIIMAGMAFRRREIYESIRNE